MSKKSTKLEALHDLFEENNIQVDLIEGNAALIEAVKKCGSHSRLQTPVLCPASAGEHCHDCVFCGPG